MSLWTFSLQDKKATQFADVQSANPINAAFSPDGRWVAYTVTEGGVAGTHVQPFPATGAKYQVSNSSSQPVWSRDGRELVSQPPGGQGAVQRNYDLTSDGRVLGVVPAGQTQSTGSTPQQIEVVLNWFEELKARVPVP